MPTPYSVDLRARVIEDVETGASRREAGEGRIRNAANANSESTAFFRPLRGLASFVTGIASHGWRHGPKSSAHFVGCLPNKGEH